MPRIKYKDCMSDLSDDDKSILDWIWSEFVRSREWPSCESVHVKYRGPDVVKEKLNRIGGVFVRQIDSGHPGPSYSLTSLGMMACPSNDSFEEALVLLLDHLVELHDQKKLPCEQPQIQIARDISLETKRISAFEALLYKLRPVGSAIHWNWNAGKIHFKATNELAKLLQTGLSRTYIHNFLFRSYDKVTPVYISDQRTQQSEETWINIEELNSLIDERDAALKAIDAFEEDLRTRCRRHANVLSWLVYGPIGLLLISLTLLPQFALTLSLIVRFAFGGATLVCLWMTVFSKKNLRGNQITTRDRWVLAMFHREKDRILETVKPPQEIPTGAELEPHDEAESDDS